MPVMENPDSSHLFFLAFLSWEERGRKSDLGQGQKGFLSILMDSSARHTGFNVKMEEVRSAGVCT